MPTPDAPRPGPHDPALLASVARRFYLDDRSKVEIAAELGLSRFKVARLLTEARERGVVRIEVVTEPGLDLELAARLRRHLGLRHAVVADLTQGALRSPAAEAARRRTEVGRLGAGLLQQVLTERDVLGLPWSRTVAAMVLALRRLPAVPVVQLTGALSLSHADATGVDVIREATRLCGGPAWHFYAPLVASDTASAAILRAQPGVAEALRQVPRVTVAAVGIGAWEPGESTLHDLLTEAEQQAVADAGAVGEISGAFVDAGGREVDCPAAERFVGVDAAGLRGVDHVIGLATGARRATVVRAGVVGGLVNSLVCDVELARALLGQAGGPVSGRAG